MVAPLHEYEVANKNLERKLEEGEVSSTAVSRERFHVEDELATVRTEKRLLGDTTEEMTASAVREKKLPP